MLTLRFDGLFREVHSNPERGAKAGFLSYGWLISRGETIIARGHGVFAHHRDATSNVAEYLALIEGLEALDDLGIKNEPVEIRGDAKCIIDQMLGTANVSSARTKRLYQRAKQLAGRFLQVTWTWTPRRNNRAADLLTRLAMKQMRADRAGYQAAMQAIDPQNGSRPPRNKFLPVIDLRVYHPLIYPRH